MQTDNKPILRFAPTVSGVMHLGSLWNAMLNYLYAAKNSGSFKVRMDGHYIRGTRIADRDAILADLKLFGFEWDEEIHQADRLQEHVSEFKKLVADNPERFYECDCTINDIAKRNLFPLQNPMYRLLRPEKYPRPCRLQRIQIFDSDDKDIAFQKSITASHESRDCPAVILTTDEGSYHKFWTNTDIGNMCSPEMTTLIVDLQTTHSISGIQLDFREYPFLDYQIHVKQNGDWKTVLRVNKPVEYFVEPKPSVPYPANRKERLFFAPVETDAVRIDITRLPLPLDRPYHYDYHCKQLNKKLDWNDLKTVVRCHYNDETLGSVLDFMSGERLPNKKIRVDTAAWFDGKPDLVFTSPYDDRKMGATHLIRGVDIRPFLSMEIMLSHLLGFQPLHYYHPMVVNKTGVKYSKFIKSPALSSYISDKVTPGKILGYLAWKGRLVDSYPGEVSLNDLVLTFNLSRIGEDNIVVDDKEMVDYLAAL